MVWGVAIAPPAFPSSDGGNDCSAALRCVLKFDLGSRALKETRGEAQSGSETLAGVCTPLYPRELIGHGFASCTPVC